MPQEVWLYTVGGRDIVKSWFNYRKANPTGRRTSPLNNINATTWQAEWNGELIDLLSVLSRLTELQDAQAELLGSILEHPVATHADLATAGVTWPTTEDDPQRRPDLSARVAEENTGPGQLGFTFGDDAT